MRDRLKAIRKESGLTQEKFASEIGVSANFIAIAETSERKLGKQTIKTMCRRFGISEEWFYTGEGDMHVDSQSDDDLFEWVGAALGNDPFKRKFLQILSQLKPDAWNAIEILVEALLERQEQDADSE